MFDDDYDDSKNKPKGEESKSARMRKEFPLPPRKENVDNLVAYLDKNNNGVITLENIRDACNLDYDPQVEADKVE